MSFVEGSGAEWQEENAQIETEATKPWLSFDGWIGPYWVTFDMYAYLRND
jgi:hypothetical protein